MELDSLKEADQELEDDIATPWTFQGEALFLKPHGSGCQWRWILHCLSLHLDVGKGKLNGIIGKARLSSVYLWQYDSGDTLSLPWDFLQHFYGSPSRVDDVLGRMSQGCRWRRGPKRLTTTKGASICPPLLKPVATYPIRQVRDILSPMLGTPAS